MFWTPPTSPVCSSGTEETVTLPSCEASAPIPRPASNIGQVHDLRPSAHVERATMTTMPANNERNPIWTTRRGDRSETASGHPRRPAASDGQRQQPHAGRDRRQPERHRQEQRHGEEQASLQEVLEEKRDKPAAQDRVPQHRRINQRGGAARQRRFSHHKKTRSTTPPARISQITGDNPSHSGAPALGWTKPHVPERRTPYTTSPRPSADNTVPMRSSRAPSSAGVSAIRRVSPKMMSTTRTSPANTHRQEA